MSRIEKYKKGMYGFAQLTRAQKAVIWGWWEAALPSMPLDKAGRKWYLAANPATALELAYLEQETSERLAGTRETGHLSMPQTSPLRRSSRLASKQEATRLAAAEASALRRLSRLALKQKATTDLPTPQADDGLPSPTTPTLQLYLKKMSIERDGAGKAPIVLDRGQDGSVAAFLPQGDRATAGN